MAARDFMAVVLPLLLNMAAGSFDSVTGFPSAVDDLMM
jgi:hypothetical protein